MRTRRVWQAVLVVVTLVIMAGLGLAQEPEVVDTPPLPENTEIDDSLEGGTKLLDEPKEDWEWAQSVGEKGLDAYSVERRSTKDDPWETMMALNALGELMIKGEALGLDGSFDTGLTFDGVTELYAVVNGQQVLGLWSDGVWSHAEVYGDFYVGLLNGGTPWTSANDGAGSGLDADLLDGLDSSTFAAAGHNHDATYVNDDAGEVGDADVPVGSLSADRIDGTAWTSINDGADSGLDADLVDGLDSSAFAGVMHNHDAAYWKLTGNAGTTPGFNFLGTSDNVALTLAVNGTVAFRLEPDATSPNVVAGYHGNGVPLLVHGATIGGGGSSGAPNSVYGDFGTVGGGQNNRAIAQWSTIGGGSDNTAWGNAPWATVGGGQNNSSSDHATVSGGQDNQASGQRATVGGGQNNQASAGWATVGGGEDNQANGGWVTVAGGENNNASGPHATIGGGRDNQASGGLATVAGGSRNEASGGTAAVGGGDWNQASADLSTVAGGLLNQAIYQGATVGGGEENVASNWCATVGGGHDNQASGLRSTIGGGFRNESSADYATVGGGQENQASGQRATVGGGENNQASQSHTTVGGGKGNRASTDYATVGGGEQNQASGNWATVGGGRDNTANTGYATVGGGWENTGSGAFGTVGGGIRNEARQDYDTVGGGAVNIADGYCATVSGGEDNTASEQFVAIGGGFVNSASGSGATIGGGMRNQASGELATVPGGLCAAATHYGETAHASGRFSSYGDAQESTYVLRNTTDGDETKELFLDGASATQRLTIVSGRTVTFDILVVARDAVGNSAGYQATGVIENVSGSTAFIGTPTVTTLGEDILGWNISVLADTTNAALVVKGVGSGYETIRWVATVRTAEVAF